MITIRAITDRRADIVTREQCVSLREGASDAVLWIHAVGDGEDVTSMLRDFGLEEWIVEDMMETSTHPKAESWPDALFLVVFGVEHDLTEERFELRTAEVDVVLGNGWVVTHTSEESAVLDRVADLIGRDARMAATASHLVHLLLDHLADGYVPFIDEFIPGAIDEIEDRLFSGIGDAAVRQEIYLRRRDVQRLRRIASPQAAAVRRFATLADGDPLRSRHLFTDIADRLDYVASQTDSLRDQLNAAFDHYQSLVAHSQNEVMKVLTMVSATLLPITVITGIYGMNFRYMPELDERWGYPLALALSALIVLVNIAYFRGKGWIGRRQPGAADPRTIELDHGLVLPLPSMGARGLASTTKRLVRRGPSR